VADGSDADVGPPAERPQDLPLRQQGISGGDVIDVPFMLKPNQLDAYGPIAKGKKAIGLAIAMNDFAGTFFAGGGVPPLALEGPLPQGRRVQARPGDIQRAIDLAKKAGTPFFGMPPGHALKAIGIDPDKGQMTEARLFQIQEIARLLGPSAGVPAGPQQRDLLQHRAAGSAAREAPDRPLGQGSSRTSST
jgi:phage portal protein BeeE